jgi:hypothetical protein
MPNKGITNLNMKLDTPTPSLPPQRGRARVGGGSFVSQLKSNECANGERLAASCLTVCNPVVFNKDTSENVFTPIDSWRNKGRRWGKSGTRVPLFDFVVCYSAVLRKGSETIIK